MAIFEVVECLEISKFCQLQHLLIIPVLLGIVVKTFDFFTDFSQLVVSLIYICCSVFILLVIYCTLNLLDLLEHFIKSVL